MRYITIFLLFLLPLVYAPWGTSPFETPKIFIAEFGIILLTLAFIWENSFKSHRKTHLLQYIPLVGVILLTLIDLIFFQTTTTFLGNIFRFQGIFLLWLLILFCVISSFQKLTIPITVPILTLFGIFIGTFLFGFDGSQRLISFLGEPNALAATLVFIVPFFFRIKRKDVRYVLLGSALVLILLTRSRSGIIAFGVETFFLLSVLQWKFSTFKILIISICIILGSFVLPFLPHGETTEDRAIVWKTAVIAGARSPIIGGGFGNVESLMQKTAKQQQTPMEFVYVDSAHNIFLDWWMEGGVIGLGILLLLCGYTLNSFLKQKNYLYLSCFLGTVTCLSYNPASIPTLVAFWWLIGQGIGRDGET